MIESLTTFTSRQLIVPASSLPGATDQAKAPHNSLPGSQTQGKCVEPWIHVDS